MSQDQAETTMTTAVERAEQFWDNVGQSIKTLTLRAGQGVWQTTTSFPKKFSQTEQPPTESSEQPPSNPSADVHTEESNAPAMERAEQLVGAMGQRLGQWTSAAGLQIQRTTARVREDAEDVLAEAQSIRRRNARQ